MEQSLTAWLLPALTLLAGTTIGFLLSRLPFGGNTPQRTQQQLDELQERFDAYQREVITHFNTTANLVKKLSQSYQDVQEHLTDGADRLALDEMTRQRLRATLHTDPALPVHRERLTPPKNTEAPKDYAPKTEGEPGTLDEHFGLKNKY